MPQYLSHPLAMGAVPNNFRMVQVSKYRMGNRPSIIMWISSRRGRARWRPGRTRDDMYKYIFLFLPASWALHTNRRMTSGRDRWSFPAAKILGSGFYFFSNLNRPTKVRLPPAGSVSRWVELNTSQFKQCWEVFPEKVNKFSFSPPFV